MRFENDRFVLSGDYLQYEGRFVARFKYHKRDVASFKRFLIENFEVEEYFSRLVKEAPISILESKGFLLSHIKKWLKEAGYPVTREGYAQYISNKFLVR